jgi:hypothetical protein
MDPVKPKFVPAPLRPSLHAPYGSAEGAVIPHVGRYAREVVLLAFEMIGGVDRMADWASKNPGEFYTRLFTKVITREVEVNASESVEDLLLMLERAKGLPGAHLGAPAEAVEGADYDFEDT